jgi:hypothetical protein
MVVEVEVEVAAAAVVVVVHWVEGSLIGSCCGCAYKENCC